MNGVENGERQERTGGISIQRCDSSHQVTVRAILARMAIEEYRNGRLTRRRWGQLVRYAVELRLTEEEAERLIRESVASLQPPLRLVTLPDDNQPNGVAHAGLKKLLLVGTVVVGLNVILRWLV